MCLLRDLYNIAISDGEDSQLRNDFFAITCAKENITQPMLIELARNPLAIRDCYPHSKRNMEKSIYLLTAMLLIEGNCTENAISDYKYSMYKLGLDDADMVKVVVALGQSNPKFQSAAISYIAYVDANTLTKLSKKKSESASNKLYDKYSELIHAIIPPNAQITYLNEDNCSCCIIFKMRFTDYTLIIFDMWQQEIEVKLLSSSNLNGIWKFPISQSQNSMAKEINDWIDMMICKDI